MAWKQWKQHIVGLLGQNLTEEKKLQSLPFPGTVTCSSFFGSSSEADSCLVSPGFPSTVLFPADPRVSPFDAFPNQPESQPPDGAFFLAAVFVAKSENKNSLRSFYKDHKKSKVTENICLFGNRKCIDYWHEANL